MNNVPKIGFLLLLIVFSAATGIHAQDAEKYKSNSFCSETWNSSNKNSVAVRDLREISFASTGSLNVDAGKNGGIRVRGENRADIAVRACVQAWARTEAEANLLAKNVRIETGSNLRVAEAAAGENFSVSFEIAVPRATNLNLTARNGGIAIQSVEGDLQFQTQNGGISLSDLAGTVRGKTTNGGIVAKLTGKTWQGTGFDVQTTNGGIRLTMAADYAARVQTGTVNGKLRSDFPELNTGDESDPAIRMLKRSIDAGLNGGGATVRAVTTNGAVSIDFADN